MQTRVPITSLRQPDSLYQIDEPPVGPDRIKLRQDIQKRHHREALVKCLREPLKCLLLLSQPDKDHCNVESRHRLFARYLFQSAKRLARLARLACAAVNIPQRTQREGALGIKFKT